MPNQNQNPTVEQTSSAQQQVVPKGLLEAMQEIARERGMGHAPFYDVPERILSSFADAVSKRGIYSFLASWVRWLRVPRRTRLKSHLWAFSSDLTEEISNRFALPAEIREGTRNDTLHRYAASLRAEGCDPWEVRELVSFANQVRCFPPLFEREVVNIANGVSRLEPHPGLALSAEDRHTALDAAISVYAYLCVSPDREPPLESGQSLEGGNDAR